MAKTVKLTEQTWRKLNALMNNDPVVSTPWPGRPPETSIVRVRNLTDAVCQQFHILGLQEPMFDPATFLDAFKRHPIVLKAVTPSAADHSLGRFVIGLEPIASGAIGRAMAAGVCPVQVHITDTAHCFADIANNDGTQLASTASGPCTLLWKETGTGTRWSIIRFGGSGGGNSIRKAYCKTAAPSSASIECYLDVNGAAASVWGAGTTYYQNQAASYDGKAWTSLKNFNTNHIPGNVNDPGWWAEITVVYVQCEIAGGTTLSSAIPRLAAGTLMYVENSMIEEYGGSLWRSLVLFQASMEGC